jgi:hypothetical protein
MILLALHKVIAPSSMPPAMMPCSSSWSIQSSEEKRVGLKVLPMNAVEDYIS